MICEVCGKNVPRLRKVLIEGAVMNVCDECARLGVPVEDKKVLKPRVVHNQPQQREQRRQNDFPDESEVLVEDYGERVRRARESRNLTLEEAAKKLLEKKNVLSKIERGEMKPDRELIRKLEKFYSIKLTEKVSHEASVSKVKGEGLTLGDIIKKG